MDVSLIRLATRLRPAAMDDAAQSSVLLAHARRIWEHCKDLADVHEYEEWDGEI